MRQKNRGWYHVKGISGEVLALVEIRKEVLSMHNIDSHIKNQYLSGAVGEVLPNESWPQLWVAEQDFERASMIIEEAQRDSPESGAIQKSNNLNHPQ